MMLQLNPPLPVVTPLGPALAHILIDYGCEHDLHWVCIQKDTCEIWTWSNPDIRAAENITERRTLDKEPSIEEPRRIYAPEPNAEPKTFVFSATTLGMVVDVLSKLETATMKEIAMKLNMNESRVYQCLMNHPNVFERLPLDGKRGMKPYYYRLKHVEEEQPPPKEEPTYNACHEQRTMNSEGI